MSVKNYEELKVWQKAMDAVTEVYRLTKGLPKEEIYGLVNQMRRAVVSVPSNIAEGNSRSTSKEYVHFLSVSRASAAEVKTQLLICERLEYLSREEITVALELLDEVMKMLYAIMQKLR